MINSEREDRQYVAAEKNAEKKGKPAKEEKSIKQTRKEQHEHADPKEQSPKRKGYG